MGFNSWQTHGWYHEKLLFMGIKMVFLMVLFMAISWDFIHGLFMANSWCCCAVVFNEERCECQIMRFKNNENIKRIKTHLNALFPFFGTSLLSACVIFVNGGYKQNTKFHELHLLKVGFLTDNAFQTQRWGSFCL